MFCAPSLGGESFGVVLLEAMAARTPIVASDLPGYRNVAPRGRRPAGARPGDAGAWPTALGAVLDDRPERAVAGAAGDERAEAFSMATLAAEYTRSTAELLDRGPERGGRGAGELLNPLRGATTVGWARH